MGKLHKRIKRNATKGGLPSFSLGHNLTQQALGRERAGKINPLAKAANDAHEENFDAVHPLGTEMERTYDARKEAEAAAAAEEAKPAIPMPDEERLARARRRASQRRRGYGRESTLLGSDQETLG